MSEVSEKMPIFFIIFLTLNLQQTNPTLFAALQGIFLTAIIRIRRIKRLRESTKGTGEDWSNCHCVALPNRILRLFRVSEYNKISCKQHADRESVMDWGEEKKVEQMMERNKYLP